MKRFLSCLTILVFVVIAIVVGIAATVGVFAGDRFHVNHTVFENKETGQVTSFSYNDGQHFATTLQGDQEEEVEVWTHALPAWACVKFYRDGEGTVAEKRYLPPNTGTIFPSNQYARIEVYSFTASFGEECE